MSEKLEQILKSLLSLTEEELDEVISAFTKLKNQV